MNHQHSQKTSSRFLSHSFTRTQSQVHQNQILWDNTEQFIVNSQNANYHYILLLEMQLQHSLENIKSSWLSFRGCKAFRKQKPPKFTKAKSVGYIQCITPLGVQPTSKVRFTKVHHSKLGFCSIVNSLTAQNSTFMQVIVTFYHYIRDSNPAIFGHLRKFRLSSRKQKVFRKQ